MEVNKKDNNNLVALSEIERGSISIDLNASNFNVLVCALDRYVSTEEDAIALSSEDFDARREHELREARKMLDNLNKMRALLPLRPIEG